MKYYIIILAFILLSGQGLFAQDNIWSPYDIGTYSSPFSFAVSDNTNYFTDDNGDDAADVYYKITMSAAMNLTISTCGSELAATDITVLDEAGNQLTDARDQGGYGTCSASEQANLSLRNLQPGTYYFIIEGIYSNGNITTTITGLASGGSEIGDTMDNPIDVGVQSGNFTYSDTQNTTTFTDNYGQSSNDVYYRFTLSQATTVTLSHCGSGLSDTYLQLLNTPGVLISENDDYSGVGGCNSTVQSYIKQDLPAGTYYVVSEGYGSANGSITTNIQGLVSSSSGGGSVLTGSAGQNYIFSITPTVASPTAGTLTTSQSLQTIQYFDGLGRPVQTVQGCITPAGADLVSGIEYNGFGRDHRHWLPGAAVGNNGTYVSDFGAKATSTNGGDTNPYATTEYDGSPLNRVTGQCGAGVDWYNNTKKKTITYTTNGSNVKYYYIEGAQLKCNSTYATSTLYGQKTTDEDGKTVEEFTDKQGRKILSRVAEDDDTYYVYDDLNNLRYVLPPMAADALGTNTSGFDESTTSTLGLYGYIYHYDGGERCTDKKLPGCDGIYMVYNHADRLILSQDGNQRLKPTKQWTVTKYDALGRVLFTGLINSDDSRATMESNYSGSVTNESYTGTGRVGGYTSANLTPSTVLTVNYYDNYSFISNGMLNYDSSQEQNGYTAQYNNAKGLLTGTLVYRLNDPTKFETTVFYYDKYGRVVQTRATNHLGGYDINYNDLDFTSKPTRAYKTHSINGTTASVTELYTYTYDKAQRMLTTTYSLNGGGSVTLVANGYDELGRLTSKNLGGVDATTYSYNVRSWTTDIVGSKFTENLYYNVNPLSSNVCYNGNISGMQWSVPNEGLGYNRAYTFGYDGLNRLIDANYCGFNGSAVAGTTGMYNEHFGFDKMGNIMTLTRNENGSLLNNLSFTYTGNQLKKVDNSISPYIPYGSEAFNDKQKIDTEYYYDQNGSTIADVNTGISTIQYNLLNLPNQIQFTEGHKNIYTYDAIGKKLETVNYTVHNIVNVPINTISTLPANASDYTRLTTDYVGNIIYENGSLKQILLPEGYYQGGVYYYYLKDHLGNNRLVINSSGAVVEKSHYYPSGMRFSPESTSNSAALLYRYNGKELESMNGLNQYDYGARRRGTGLPIWTAVDPLAENHYDVSPYAYCLNNPINSIDPLGLDTVNVNTQTPVKKGDVMVDNKGVIGTASTGEVTVTPKQKNDNSISIYKPLSPSDREFYKKHPEGLDQVNIEFAILTGVSKPGLSALSWLWNNIINPPPPSTTLTVNANAARVVNSSNGKGFKKLNDSFLKNKGLDAHSIKKEFLGNSAQISRYDLYTDTRTGEILILGKGGIGNPIQTGYFSK